MSTEILTIDEVAKILCVSLDTVYQLVASGTLVGRKVGRIWRIPWSAVQQYLHSALHDSALSAFEGAGPEAKTIVQAPYASTASPTTRVGQYSVDQRGDGC
jgi:excisionase family DNA binding protein